MRQAIVTLKKGEGRLLKSGGAWIFDNEIDSIMGEFENGDIVIVHDFDGYGMGRGFINMNSKIRIRMMTRKQDQEIDHAFLEMRVRDAWEYRKKTVDTSSCRVIFGEADFLPGLVIDKFSDVLVVESLALGIDRMKEEIVDILKAVLSEDGITIRGVYERSDAKVRQNEGMERVKGFIGEEFDTKVEIVENGVRYMVDVKDGQKTGFFLDQKYNRLAIQKLCKNARVLDCFTHTGSFALNAGYAGAKEVTGVDASQLAVDQATANAALNGLSDSVKFICEDVFDLLPKLEEKGEKDIERKVLHFFPADTGKTYWHDGESYWRVMAFIPNARTYETVNPEYSYYAGVAFGNFQAMLADIPDKLGETIPDFHNMEFRLKQLRDAVAADAAGRVKEVRYFLDEIERRAEEMCKAERLHREGKLPKRVCHCDTKVNNMMFDESGNVLCVIDLDTVMPSFVFSDFGDFLRSGANTGLEDDKDLANVNFNMEIFKAFTKGYLESAKSFLLPVEIENLPYAAALFPYMQCVRFLADYINGDTYYKIQYPEHNLVRTKAQFKLLQSVEEHTPEMQEFIASCIR